MNRLTETCDHVGCMSCDNAEMMPHHGALPRGWSGMAARFALCPNCTSDIVYTIEGFSMIDSECHLVSAFSNWDKVKLSDLIAMSLDANINISAWSNNVIIRTVEIRDGDKIRWSQEYPPSKSKITPLLPEMIR